MRRFYSSLLALVLLLVAVPASAQIGVFSRVKFGAAFLDAVADCTTLTQIGVCVDTDNGSLWIRQSGVWTQVTPGAPTTATYITQTANGTLSAEQFLGGLATGLLKNATTTGVLSIASAGTDYYAPAGTDVAFADGGTGVSSAADDTTLVSTGSAWQPKAIPDCDDSSGNHLNYDTATNGFSCGTSTSGGASGSITASGYTMTTARILGRTSASTGAIEELTSVPFSLGGLGLTSAADDTVPVSSGSAYVATAVPSCSNATTSKLLYNVGTNAFSCGADQDNGSAASNYQTVQDEGSDLAQQPKLNFIGAGVTCVDGASKTDCTITSSGAPTGATYITQTADGTLSAEQALSSLSTGVVKVTTTTGVLSTATEGTDYYKPGGTDVAFADGGTGLSSASDDTTLVSNGSAWQAKAVPDCTDTSGNHLNYTASSNTLSCGTTSSGGGSGGGWTLLESHDASTSASLVFSTRNASGQSGNSFQSDFDDYVVRIVSLIPSTASTNLNFQISVNAGANWNAANCHYAISSTTLTGAPGLLGSGNPSTVGISMAQSVDGSSGVNGQVDLFTPLNASLDKQFKTATTFRVSGNYVTYNGGCLCLSTSAIDQVRLIPVAGTLLSGSARLYGVQK